MYPTLARRIEHASPRGARTDGNDGKADIALTGGTGWNTMPVAFSNGDGTFHGTNGGMTQGLTVFPTYASEENVKPVAR